VGQHGLPLIGGGDWNDGMNRVGIAGRGESVWLGWFLYKTLHEFADLCERIGEDGAAAYRQQAAAYQTALESNGWDGAWYRRAYDDDGVPLGSAQNEEAQIDAIAQSWAVLSGAGGPQRARRPCSRPMSGWFCRRSGSFCC
jgi:cellobiose phosphorylase